MASLLRASPFAFPHRAPGYNPAHIAALNCRFSAVASNANCFNVLTGNKGTIVGTPTATIDGAIGPCTVVTGANYCSFTGFTGSDIGLTLAVIFTAPSAPTSSMAYLNSTIGGNIQFWGDGEIWDAIPATSYGPTTYTIAAKTPYFLVTSIRAGAQASVIKNLHTGASQTFTGTNANVLGAYGSGTYIVGGKGNGGGSGTANIAAAAYIGRYLALPVLNLWAADPWAFWYPHTELETLNWLSVAVARPQEKVNWTIFRPRSLRWGH